MWREGLIQSLGELVIKTKPSVYVVALVITWKERTQKQKEQESRTGFTQSVMEYLILRNFVAVVKKEREWKNFLFFLER